MNELEIKRVPFMGTELMAARDEDGQIWAGVRWMCNGIGLSKGQMQRQVTNIGADTVLSKGVANLQLPTSGGIQECLCLKLDYVPLWLAKISITPTMEEETPELAATLEQYQLRAKDVLAAAFLPERYPPPKQALRAYPRKSYSVGEVTRIMHELQGIMKDNSQSPEKISEMAKNLCDQFEINLPPDFVNVKRNPFEQIAFFRRILEDEVMVIDINKEWKGLAELIAITRVVMQDMNAPQQDIVQMENEQLEAFGVVKGSELAEKIIDWSYKCRIDVADDDEDWEEDEDC